MKANEQKQLTQNRTYQYQSRALGLGFLISQNSGTTFKLLNNPEPALRHGTMNKLIEFDGGVGSSLGTSSEIASQGVRRVGLIYDERMCRHHVGDDEDHPECPDRIRVIWDRLNSSGLAKSCVILEAKDAEDSHLALVHTKSHINLIKKISSQKPESKRNHIAAKFCSLYFNEGSSEAASLAAGSVVEVVERVAKGELDSAFAIVRPPGHHAEEGLPMGFCLYNNVAVATSYLLNERGDLGIRKILIVDWDVHHGNGTQKMFYSDSRVLFFSVHRHESGTFYPGGDDGSYVMTGEGPGAGYNINVPWENSGYGDADYVAVWDHILIPVVKEFNPDMIVISAGFDAAIDDPLGGCCLSPLGYSIMLEKLMKFAGGKIAMALEGGYNLDSIAKSAQACVEVLLQDKKVIGSLETRPRESTWQVIREVRKELSIYWPVLAGDIESKVVSGLSQVKIIDDVIKPLESLKLTEDVKDKEVNAATPSWRSELSRTSVWYATFGSNMSIPRFRCYIDGGQIEGMRRPCVGSRDKSMPKDIIWKTFPHRLFFAHEHTDTWGPGGAAFLHPQSNADEKAYMCLYRITLEQFNDVLHQENISSIDTNRPLFDLMALQTIQTEKSITMESLKSGWYKNVVYLGQEKGLPILTMTCTLSDVDSFISGQFPFTPPNEKYAGTLIKGLVEGNQLSQEEASAYIQEASTKPLGIDSLHEDGKVSFIDGSSIIADTIIYCTGYSYSFPFLDTKGLVVVDEDRVGPLYEHTFPPSLAPSLSFIGIPRKIIGFPFFECQAKWIAQVLSGKRSLPSWDDMMQPVQEFYYSREAAGIPKHNTHDIACFEYCDNYADHAGFPNVEEWRKELCLSALRRSETDLETYRDSYKDDDEMLQVAFSSPHFAML